MNLERNILIDGNNLLHRAHAIFVKNRIEDPLIHNGYPTGLIYGTFSMLSDWISDIYMPTCMILFLDGVPARRRVLDPNYKIKDVDPSIGVLAEGPEIILSDGFRTKFSVEVIRHITSLLGIDIFHHPAEEADDLIASFVKFHANDINVVVSSDTDFYQLLDNRNTVILFRPGVKGNKFFDAERAEEDMVQRYKIKTGARIPPSAVRMFKSLTGDTSDKIVGIPFLRKKVAAPLCCHKDVDSLYATGLPGFSKKEKEKALALKERIRLNYELVGLIDTIDLESILIKAKPDFELAAKILRDDLGITSIPVHAFSFKNPGIRISDAIPDTYSDPAYAWMKDI